MKRTLIIWVSYKGGLITHNKRGILCVYAADLVGYRYNKCAIRSHRTPNKTVCVHYEKHTSVNYNSSRKLHTHEMRCHSYMRNVFFEQFWKKIKTNLCCLLGSSECAYACVINTNHLKMSNTKQFLCHITFLFYYTHTHTDQHKRVSEYLMKNRSCREWKNFIQMEMFSFLFPFTIFAKWERSSANSNLQFCVSIRALNIQHNTHRTIHRSWVWIAWTNTKNQTSCSTTVNPFELNFLKWNCVRCVSLAGSLHRCSHSYSHTSVFMLVYFFWFVCRYNAELSGLWFQQIFPWIIQKLHIHHKLGCLCAYVVIAALAAMSICI